MKQTVIKLLKYLLFRLGDRQYLYWNASIDVPEVPPIPYLPDDLDWLKRLGIPHHPLLRSEE